MQKGTARGALLRSGMGCFLFASAVSAANALLLPYARGLYGYPLGPTLAAFALALLAFLTLGRALRGRDARTLERAASVAAPAFLCALFLAQLALGYLMAYTPAGDNHMLIDGARMLAEDGNFAANPDYALYLSRFSNQWGFLLILTALFRLFAALGIGDPLFALAALQAALYAAGLRAALDIARKLSGARGVLTLVAMLALLPPLYLAAAVLYTDTFSLPFVLLTLRFALLAPDGGTTRARVGRAALAALFACLGAQIKPTVFIALIAAGIVWLLSLRPREAVACCALSVAIACAGSLGVRGVMLSRVLDPDMVAQHHTPAIHWVMMSIPTGDNPYGGMNNGDYAQTWGMMEQGASREEVDASIAARVKDRIYTLRYPNRLAAAALRKNAAAMGDGTFGMTEMLDDGPVRENAISSFVLEGRPRYALYGAVCTGIWLAHMALAAAGCLRDIRRRDTRAAMLCVAMFGLMLFLMLWEARSRYAFGFVPVLLLLSCRFAASGEGRERA